ncbi:MAG: alpha/beta hydrolase [Actinomycetota bacterium]|nr:alpha/beta hydrolase [Actinomycetota bacterium]
MDADPPPSSVVLADGRRLTYDTLGDQCGVPIVAVHGSPDSRVIWRLFADAAQRGGLRLIAVDRPGFGGSDPLPGRRVLDWAEDVVALTDAIGVHRFGLLAISGGGVYACATAWRWPDRVTVLGLFSVIGPLDVPGATQGMNRFVRTTYGLARRAPWLLRPIVRSLATSANRAPEKATARMLKMRPPEDRDVIQRSDVAAVLARNLPEQFRDSETILHEFRLATQPWPVPLHEIRTPTFIWQGGRDDVHVPAMARELARAIPGATLYEEPTFATFTYVDHVDAILDVLRQHPSLGDATR